MTAKKNSNSATARQARAISEGRGFVTPAERRAAHDAEVKNAQKRLDKQLAPSKITTREGVSASTILQAAHLRGES